MGEIRNAYIGHLKGRDHLGDLDVDGRIIMLLSDPRR
jgi:hypothetical protein